MKEFKLFIRNQSDNFNQLTPVEQSAFLKKCEAYINKLKKEGKLLGAQPMERQGKIVYFTEGTWYESEYDLHSNEVIVGYYHILASDMEEAIEIAKANPEFEFGTTANIEIRPVKTKEISTGFVYPKKEG